MHLTSAKVRSTVLLVEDEPLVRMEFAELLNGAGYVVLEARSAPEALRHVVQEPIDLLITDIQMPGEFDGLDLIKIARECLPGLPILIVSARPAYTLGEWASCLISKPARPLEILERVRRALDGDEPEPRLRQPNPMPPG